MSTSLTLPTPESFPVFPYPNPYEIQLELMTHLYEAIESRKVTVIESPTGTGKTSSLLCASLTWLHDERNRARKGKLEEAATGDDWVAAQTRDRLRRELEAEDTEYEKRLTDARLREAKLKNRARVWKKPKLDDKSPPVNLDDEAIFLPEEDGEAEDEEMNLSPAVKALMARLNPDNHHDEPEPTCTKIYYASRTHSQLTQVLPEMGKLKLPASVSVSSVGLETSSYLGKRKSQSNDEDETYSFHQSRALSLGSRKHLCIHDELRAKSRDIDEGCRELLAEKKENRCPYLPPIEEEVKMNDFKDQILPTSKLITLPYNLLLQKSAREALGIDLKDQVVIVDEGHNLISTLLSLSTVHLSLALLQTALYQVTTYVAKFRNRLNAANLVHLKRLLAFLQALEKYLEEWRELKVPNPVNTDMRPLIAAKVDGKPSTQTQEVVTPLELSERMGRKVAGVNLLEIVQYLKKSKIARKISGYADKLREKEGEVSDGKMKARSRKGVVPPLHTIEDLMTALAGATDDGRISITLVGNQGPPSKLPSRMQFSVEIKYHLLNPAPHFRDVVDEARAVIIAGGTMSPISDVQNQLFSHLPPERITSFSCGHIIPPENILTLAVAKGPSGRELDFRAGKQGDAGVLADLGQIILNLTRVVPKGMIVFFPSYKFLDMAKAAWSSETGSSASGFLDKFGSKKKVFVEPEDQTGVEGVLKQYAVACSTTLSSSQPHTGALLLAVIGAKLSEGLNFADDLARAVVVVGLPFANLASAELQERMRYVKREEEKRFKKAEVDKENHSLGSGASKLDRKGKDAAAELYENMCMNAVNQSIGRAIRHRNDWAALVLLDQRYSTPNISNKLPKWLGGEKLVVPGSFGGVMKELGGFYRQRGNQR
ncbi:hypothetical protein D9757_010662 [Collybiopsis confluens]|uniref:ATP-dependent DNA helicase CHL1 n=1 Tax=Collybiopsis confluens TaxID=2823264 RepID=A0A8H5GM38_9AGAR|nr:hypothetical protein D9757_010662 [Collybiopsis confluens]